MASIATTSECVVCYMNMCTERSLQCGHFVCSNCLVLWFNSCDSRHLDRTCPYCRTILRVSTHIACRQARDGVEHVNDSALLLNDLNGRVVQEVTNVLNSVGPMGILSQSFLTYVARRDREGAGESLSDLRGGTDSILNAVSRLNSVAGRLIVAAEEMRRAVVSSLDQHTNLLSHAAPAPTPEPPTSPLIIAIDSDTEDEGDDYFPLSDIEEEGEVIVPRRYVGVSLDDLPSSTSIIHINNFAENDLMTEMGFMGGTATIVNSEGMQYGVSFDANRIIVDSYTADFNMSAANTE